LAVAERIAGVEQPVSLPLFGTLQCPALSCLFEFMSDHQSGARQLIGGKSLLFSYNQLLWQCSSSPQ